MSRYCLDVIYSYYAAYQRRDMKAEHDLYQNGTRTIMARNELSVLESALSCAILVNQFPIVPGFITVLNCFLGLFSIVLPFILAEISGWLTILWVLIVAYSVLGMHKVATELQIHMYQILTILILTAWRTKSCAR